MNQKCAITGCESLALKRGWCAKHYRRWLNHGDPNIVLPSGKQRTEEEPPLVEGKYQCRHKQRHFGVMTRACDWCGKSYQRPICYPKAQQFCSMWCARRHISAVASGPNSTNFQHGITSQGYKRVTVNGKRVMEHRAVMEQVLGRHLGPNEWVHHRNGVKTDNRVENLVLVTPDAHFTDLVCPRCEFHFKMK